MPMAQVWQGVSAVIVTHTHLDHWDEAAVKNLPKNLLIIVQNQADAALIKGQGFNNVKVLNESLQVGKATLHKTGGAHGTVEMFAVAHAYKAVPHANIIAVHMDAVNHTAVSRQDLRHFVQQEKMTDRVFIPNDGEKINF